MRARAPNRSIALAALVLALTARAALAQSVDCAKQPPAERAKCEQSVLAAALCGGFAGAARGACEKHVIETPSLDDCGRLSGYGRAKCETYNQGVLAEFPCAGKAGATLAVCAREQAQKVAQEK